jgi:hypothetical protein
VRKSIVASVRREVGAMLDAVFVDEVQEKGGDIAGLGRELADEFVEGVALTFWRGGSPRR